MPRVRVLTPAVAVEDTMRNAQALKVDRLAANKIRVGLLDNTKPNAGRLLGYVGELLKERGLAASTFAVDKTDSPGLPSGEQLGSSLLGDGSQPVRIPPHAFRRSCD